MNYVNNLGAPQQPPVTYPAPVIPAAQPMAAPKEDFIDLRSLFQTLWRGKWIISVSILFLGFLGFLAVAQQEDEYKATAQVMFDIQQSNVVDLNDVISQQTFDSAALEDQIYVLQSTTLIERVIDDLQLDRIPEFNPTLQVEEEGLISQYFGAIRVPVEITDFLMSVGVMDPPAPPPSGLEAERQERLTIIDNVREGLNLRALGRSRVIEISFTSKTPHTAARVVNAVADQYIIDQLEAKLEATRAATSWLAERVEELGARVRAAEDTVEDARAELSEAAGQTLDVTQQQLESLNGTLASARSEISRLEALYNRLTSATDAGRDLGAISEFRASPIIQTFRASETDLLDQRTVLAGTVPEGHPSLQRLDQRLADVRRNLAEEAARIVDAAAIDLEAAREVETSLIEEVRRLEAQALEQTRAEVRLRQLDREAEASRVLYENFLARLQETSQQEDLQEADARVLSPAEIPLTPETAKRNLMLAVSLLLGALIGTAIVFLLDRLNNTFRAPGQLEDMTGETVLAVLPAIGNRKHRRDIINHLREKPSSSLAEAVRNLRTSILFSNLDNPPKVVMFTSSVPREGKSTTSMLVALTSKQMGKSAIIVDCDLRLPALAKIVDSDEESPGLMSVLDGTANIGDAIIKDPETGLHMLMTKRSEQHGNINAADVLSSRRFQELITALSEAYDLVVLDTPPAVVVTDARILSKIADAVVYAVRWDNTPRGAVAEGLKELKSVNAPIAGMVMTMVNEARASKYTYDGYGYYKGLYKDYYIS